MSNINNIIYLIIYNFLWYTIYSGLYGKQEVELNMLNIIP